MVLHVNHTSINQVFTKASVLPAFLKANDVKHGTTQFVWSVLAVTSRASHMGRCYFLMPRGQDTPVPPRPQ